MFLKLSNVALCIVVMAMALSADENAMIKWHNAINYRRLNCLVPLHYNLKLQLMPLSAYIGESNVIININCAIQNIILHLSTYIHVTGIQLKPANREIIYKPKNIYHGEETLILDFGNQFESVNNSEYGIYILNVHYANWNFTLGLPAYTREIAQTIYTDEEKYIRCLFTNINQPRKTRQLFPYLVEPKLRATFDISVTHNLHYKALSNMPIRKCIPINNYEIRTVFHTTPPMSPNDVAYVVYVGFYKVLNSTENVNIWCRSHLIPYLRFAQHVAENVTVYLRSKWKILNNFPKLDYVIIPNFEESVKQTWGLIFHKETDDIYYEELYSSTFNKFIIMQSVTHDIMYQWFGNLFNTSCSPSQQWLKEGFNMYLETHIIDKALSNSRIMDLFVVQVQQEYFRLNTHFTIKYFMDYTNNTRTKINSYFPFSSIIGAIMWRMLENVIPHNIFWISIEKYLNAQFTYFNTTIPHDMRNIMQTAINKLNLKEYDRNIIQIMDNWIMQEHCPVLNVTRTYTRSARSYVMISKVFHDKLDQQPYFIPVTYTDEKNINFNITPPNIHHCLTQSHPTLEIEVNYDSNWVIVNIQQIGYYRVNYDPENWQIIARYLKSEKYTNIHVLNRAQIIDDAFNLAIEKKLDFSIFWELASYLWQEKDYVAWYPMIKVFEYIANIIAYSKIWIHRMHFKEVLENIEHLIEHIDELTYDQTIPTTNDSDKHLKQELAKWGCLFGNPLCMKMAKRHFKLYTESIEENKFSAAMILRQKWAYCNGFKTVNFIFWNLLWLEIPNQRNLNKILEFFTCLEDPNIVLKYLQFIQKLHSNFYMLEEKHQPLIANIFLSILSKHAKNTRIFKRILENFSLGIKISHVSENAALIVIVNNVYSFAQIDEIYKFTRRNMAKLHSNIVYKLFVRSEQLYHQVKFLKSLQH